MSTKFFGRKTTKVQSKGLTKSKIKLAIIGSVVTLLVTGVGFGAYQYVQSGHFSTLTSSPSQKQKGSSSVAYTPRSTANFSNESLRPRGDQGSSKRSNSHQGKAHKKVATSKVKQGKKSKSVAKKSSKKSKKSVASKSKKSKSMHLAKHNKKAKGSMKHVKAKKTKKKPSHLAANR